MAESRVGRIRCRHGRRICDGGGKVANPDEIVIEDDEDEVGEADVKAPPPEKEVEEPATRAAINPDEIMLDDEEEEVVKPPPPPPVPAASSSASTSQQGPGRQTKFLALDKCLPRRQFLEVSLRAHPWSQRFLSLNRLTVLRLTHVYSALTFSFRRVATATLL